MNLGLDRLARDISNEFEEYLERSGVLYRIFYRAKTVQSIESKLANKNYAASAEGKLMQDPVGVRITFYFADDLPIIHSFLQSRDNYVDQTVDELKETVFKPIRTNLVFRMSEDQSREVVQVLVNKYKYIDTTFEMQLRTVFSEGWHEVDHDLRYKRPDDWSNHSDLARTFNGMNASLITNDWAMISLFDQLAYRHYKSKQWDAMTRTRFRLRFREEALSEEMSNILNADPSFAKSLFRLDRAMVINSLMHHIRSFPLTINNFIYFVNHHYLSSNVVRNITPDYIFDGDEQLPV